MPSRRHSELKAYEGYSGQDPHHDTDDTLVAS